MVWNQNPGHRTRFSLEYQDSQRLETLDAAGKPIGDTPEFSIPKSLALDLELEWQKVTGAGASAKLRIVRIRSLALPSWSQRESVEPNLNWELWVRTGKKSELKVKTTRSARSRLRTLAGSAGAAREFQASVTAALSDTLLLFPRPKDVFKPGQIWRRTRLFALERDLNLRAEFELELIETRVLTANDEDGDPKKSVTPARVAIVEGGVRQEVIGASAELQRQPGLFPGSIRWVHDLDVGFPRLLRVRKIGRIPIPDDKLPTIKTLTHHYELKIDLARR